MNVSAATVLLFVFLLIQYAQFKQNNDDTSNNHNDTSREENDTLYDVGSELDFLYCNSILGNNKSIEIKFGNESSVLDHWIDDLPLKVITHGWYRGSRNNFTGVFIIKTVDQVYNECIIYILYHCCSIGLDPASIGFECIPIQKERLNIDDAEFVDVIHTALGILGYMERMGHVDFYPNGGVAPQPGYKLLKLAESC
ncbi:PREDICTED: uncharacterized protein LOC107165949 [Diuraphis noxia]|uniref:uncharacterized protein LOC107165949 n=1 Tax=Diuraphis noxia TaxID=143948 RepID=UPI000763844D|nr:PREDICTED: uncharacterized protein LOC107165949 [Diuraphis noxia]